MASNNLLDFAQTFQNVDQAAVTPLEHAGETQPQQQNENNANNVISAPASQLAPASGIEAELLLAHAAGVMTSSNGAELPVMDAVSLTTAGYVESVPKTEPREEEHQFTADHFQFENERLPVKEEAENGAGALNTAEEPPIATRLGKSARRRKNVDFLTGGFFSDELSSEDLDLKEDRGDDEYDPDAEDEPQKKRGRPRLSETSGATLTGRKRGRPRKVDSEGNRPQTGSTPSSEVENSSEPKVKRKRGRPRKIRPEELSGGIEHTNGFEGALAAVGVAKSTADGTDDVDLGPILMSNLNEANIDPNLDPSLYSNADASVYSPLDIHSSLLELSPVKLSLGQPNNAARRDLNEISGKPVGHIVDNLYVESVTSHLSAVEDYLRVLLELKNGLESSQVRRLGQMLDETLDAELSAMMAENGDTTIEMIEQESQSEVPPVPIKRGRGRPRKGQEIRIKRNVSDLRRSDRRSVSERKEQEIQKTVEQALMYREKLEKKIEKERQRELRREAKKRMEMQAENTLVNSSHEDADSSDTSSNSGETSESSEESGIDEEYKDRARRINFTKKKSEAPTVSPRKRGRPRKILSEEEERKRAEKEARKAARDAAQDAAREAANLPKVRKTPLERRLKKGRPSRQENVTRQVFSIFKPDSDQYFVEDATKLAESTETSVLIEATEATGATGATRTAEVLENSGDKQPTVLATFAINFDNKGTSSYSNIPIVSGIRHPTQEEKCQLLTAKTLTFEPLPIPEVDEDGRIRDLTYVETHLPGIVIHDDNNTSGRLIDERAFFLEGSEGYFEQHNLRFRPLTSSLSLNAPPLGFEEFGPFVELGLLIHKGERDALSNLHKNLYHQMCFELSQGYSLNFFGVGSKTRSIMDFLEDYFVSWYLDVILEDHEEMPPIMVVNGYNPGTKLKAVLHDMTSAVVATAVARANAAGTEVPVSIKMPKHVSEVFPFLVSHLKRQVSRNLKNRVTKASLVVVIHNIDGEAFRDERSQNILSQLALLPNVWVMVSTDNINLGLLWDLCRFRNFNFLWHNMTTYEPYSVEMSFKDVLSMGQSKKFMGSRGAKYVLASLTANAKKLYQVLLRLQMDTLTAVTATKAGRAGLKGSSKNSVDLRSVYDRCVEEFIVSNEVNFKTMLGEYVEHKMCVLGKNLAGHEVVYVPFTLDEMSMIINEEFGE